MDEVAVNPARPASSGRQRVLTAAVLVPVTLAVVIFAPAALFAVCLFAVAWLAQRELYDLAGPGGRAAYRWIGAAGAALLAAAFTWPRAGGWFSPLVAWTILGAAILVRGVADPERMEQALGRAGLTFFGIFYPAFLLALLAEVRRAPGGAGWIVLLLVVVWGGDTAAYYAGRAWGRRKLAPRISPKKTWEGTIASAVAAIVIGALFVGLVWNTSWDPGGVRAPLWIGGLLGLAINIAAQFGDLAESVIKRGAGVKDSGALLPGHGGMLDRIDALLLAIPVLWYFLRLRF